MIEIIEVNSNLLDLLNSREDFSMQDKISVKTTKTLRSKASLLKKELAKITELDDHGGGRHQCLQLGLEQARSRESKQLIESSFFILWCSSTPSIK